MNTTNIFPRLSEEVRKDYESKKAATIFYINNGYFPTWAEQHRTDPDRGLKEHLTPAKWQQYTAGAITRDRAAEIATARAIKAITKQEQNKQNKLVEVANAPRLDWVSISVDWVRSATWGHNPHAHATADNMTTTGTASGCGYDKRSAAIAQALNANPGILRILCETAEKALTDGHTLPTMGGKWGGVLGYGSGYDILPAFEGGVGVFCFGHIFEACGFSFRTGASSSRFDSYLVSRKN